MPHPVFHIVSEDRQYPHVGYDVHPASVEEHAGQERPEALYRKAVRESPSGIRISGGDQSKEIEQSGQLITGESLLQQKYPCVDGDDQPCHKRSGSAGNCISYGKQ